MKNTDDLKYLFITRTLTGGGAERFVSTFASFLAEHGYNIHILTYEISAKDYPLSDKVTLHVMPQVEDSISGKFLRIARMQQELKKINADVLIPFIDTVVVCTYLANLTLGKKFVYTVRNSPWHDDAGRFSKFMRKIIAKTADAIMLQNREQESFFSASYRKRIYIVPNPVAEKFRMCKKENYAETITRLTSVGRLHVQKNFPLLISAVKHIAAENPEVRLEIYGEGDEKKSLKALIEQQNLSSVCRLMGRTADVEGVLRETDLFVMSSDYEGMPNALIEALAMGVPSISSDCRTGPRSLMEDGQTGLLFETGKLESLQEKLAWALNHPQLMNQMGKAARENVLDTYRIEKTMSSFFAMIGGIYGNEQIGDTCEK